MRIINFVKKELSGWGKYERIIFPLEIFLIIILSVLINDNKIALFSAIFGICYTILAGKGKISCYFFGIIGTLCYSFISLKNQLFGNLALYILYYLPMQVLGIFKWKKHMNSSNFEIRKTKLTDNELILYFLFAILVSAIVYAVLLKLNDSDPLCDSVTSVFSIVGLILTVKRCIDQWYFWFIVNFLSAFMWFEAYINGSNCLATVIMWTTYTILSVYFYFTWSRDLRLQNSAS